MGHADPQQHVLLVGIAGAISIVGVLLVEKARREVVLQEKYPLKEESLCWDLSTSSLNCQQCLLQGGGSFACICCYLILLQFWLPTDISIFRHRARPSLTQLSPLAPWQTMPVATNLKQESAQCAGCLPGFCTSFWFGGTLHHALGLGWPASSQQQRLQRQMFTSCKISHVKRSRGWKTVRAKIVTAVLEARFEPKSKGI